MSSIYLTSTSILSIPYISYSPHISLVLLSYHISIIYCILLSIYLPSYLSLSNLLFISIMYIYHVSWFLGIIFLTSPYYSWYLCILYSWSLMYVLSIYLMTLLYILLISVSMSNILHTGFFILILFTFLSHIWKRLTV